MHDLCFLGVKVAAVYMLQDLVHVTTQPLPDFT